MSSSLAFRIDALHGPSWQIAHTASLGFKSTAPKSGDRILRPGNCGVKGKGTIYRGLFADLWKSVTERQILNRRRGYRPRVTRLQISSRASGTPARESWGSHATAVLDRKPPDVYSIGPSLNDRW